MGKSQNSLIVFLYNGFLPISSRMGHSELQARLQHLFADLAGRVRFFI